MRIGDPALVSQFLGHVVYIVYLDHGKVGLEPIRPFKIGQDVTAPADIAFPRTKFIFPGGWTVHFIILGYMIHAVMGTAAKFPDIIGDLDGKAVV